MYAFSHHFTVPTIQTQASIGMHGTCTSSLKDRTRQSLQKTGQGKVLGSWVHSSVSGVIVITVSIILGHRNMSESFLHL